MSATILGTGLLGFNIARRLLENDFEVTVWNRTIEKAKPLLEHGAKLATDIKDAVQRAELISVIVSDDKASLYILKNVFSYGKKGAVIVNHSTVTPSHTREMYEEAHAKGFAYVALPVMGGPREAIEGELIGVAGGDYEKLTSFPKYLETLFKKVHYVKSPEEASAVKLALNSIYFSAMIGLAEALVLAESWGCEPQTFFKIADDLWIKVLVERYGSRLLSENYPVSFKLHLAAKDMSYATIAGAEKGVSLPHIATMAQMLLSASMRKELKEEDYTRIYKFLKGLV